MNTYASMLTALQTSACLVTFRKKDDSVREMLCSLSPTITDPLIQREGGDLITVYDIRANGVRSFSASRVINFTVLVGGLGA